MGRIKYSQNLSKYSSIHTNEASYLVVACAVKLDGLETVLCDTQYPRCKYHETVASTLKPAL